MKKKRISVAQKREWLTGYLFVAPILILMAIWFYYPVFSTLRYSFTDAHMLRLDAAQFVGLKNYVQLFKDRTFWKSLKNSLLLTAVAVPVQTVLALVIAVNLNNIRKCKGLFRGLFYMPYITSAVAVVTVFSYLFLEDGIVTKILTVFGLPNTSWNADINLALPFLTIITIWTYVGYFTVIYLSGLQSIPPSLYEAADVDGATSIQKFWHITVPMLRPTTYLVVLSGMIYALQIFEQPFAMARGISLGYPAGATSTMTIFFYSQGFEYFNIGYSSAAAFIIFLLVMSFSIIQTKFTKGIDGE